MKNLLQFWFSFFLFLSWCAIPGFLTSEQIWDGNQSENISSPIHPLTAHPSAICHYLSFYIWPQSFTLFLIFALPFPLIYLKSLSRFCSLMPAHQPSGFTSCSQAFPPHFAFVSNLSLFSISALSHSLMPYHSLFHSWPNTYSTPSSVFFPPSIISLLLSQSLTFFFFTVGYIFSFFLFPPLISLPLSSSFCCWRWKLLGSARRWLHGLTNT